MSFTHQSIHIQGRVKWEMWSIFLSPYSEAAPPKETLDVHQD